MTRSRSKSGRERGAAVWDSQSRAAAGSLFDRLVADEEDIVTPRSMNPTDAVVRSIKLNLERVLNTHTGGSASNPALGVEDFNDSVGASTDATKHIVGSIRDCILTYEPRVVDVQIEPISDPHQPLNLRFSIVAWIRAANSKEQVRIDVAMRDGRFVQFN